VEPGSIEVFEGQCQCGKHRYAVSGDAVASFACHCTECQRQSSSAFGMALWIRGYHRRVSGGALGLWTRETPTGRALTCEFCASCGTRLFHQMARQTELISIKPGTLDRAGELEPVAHIWTSSAQPWTQPAWAGSLCYAQNPPDFEEIYAAWRARGGWHWQSERDGGPRD
jgi:hypothetical protein